MNHLLTATLLRLPKSHALWWAQAVGVMWQDNDFVVTYMHDAAWEHSTLRTISFPGDVFTNIV